VTARLLLLIVADIVMVAMFGIAIYGWWPA
jgi:hypothetical protein